MVHVKYLRFILPGFFSSRASLLVTNHSLNDFSQDSFISSLIIESNRPRCKSSKSSVLPNRDPLRAKHIESVSAYTVLNDPGFRCLYKCHMYLEKIKINNSWSIITCRIELYSTVVYSLQSVLERLRLFEICSF